MENQSRVLPLPGKLHSEWNRFTCGYHQWNTSKIYSWILEIAHEHYGRWTQSVQTLSPSNRWAGWGEIHPSPRGLFRRYCAFYMAYTDWKGFQHDGMTVLPGVKYTYHCTFPSKTVRISLFLVDDTYLEHPGCCWTTSQARRIWTQSYLSPSRRNR